MGTCYQSEQLKGLIFCKIILKKKMRNFVAFLAIGIMVCQALPQDMTLNRQKRVTACAVDGHVSCKVFCNSYEGAGDGVCKYNQSNGKAECHCSNPEASRRCLIDSLIESSGTYCKATCKIQGYEEGICSPQKECKCSGKSKWGHTIDWVTGQVGDFFG